MKQFIYAIFLIGISLTARSQGVGINTTNPEATLHIKGSGAMNPFMVEYGDNTKLKTFQNGGTSVGSGTIPPKNGLYVKGTLQPDSGISTPQKLLIESVGNSITLKAGLNTVVLDANGNISITSNLGGNINITSNQGGIIAIQSSGKLNLSGNELNLTGNLINIDAKVGLTIKSVSTADISSQGSMNIISSQGSMNIKGAILKLNNGGTPVAKLGSTTSAVPFGGGSATIQGDTSPTVLVP